jgi:hypothetical protein
MRKGYILGSRTAKKKTFGFRPDPKLFSIKAPFWQTIHNTDLETLPDPTAQTQLLQVD